MLTGKATWGPLMFTEPFILSFTSTLFTFFIIYNRLAGGNPPPKALRESDPGMTIKEIEQYWKSQQ